MMRAGRRQKVALASLAVIDRQQAVIRDMSVPVLPLLASKKSEGKSMFGPIGKSSSPPESQTLNAVAP